VLFNLIVNAADAMMDAGKTGKFRGSLRITTAASDGWIEIRVSDSGSGISEEHRSRIFEPFFTTKGVGRGTGQGLASVYYIVVHQHSGEIHFETEAGKGTTFIVRLPVDGIGRGSDDREDSNSVR
jgi:signal transduction histidine kinase